MASKSSPLVRDKLITPAPNAYKMASALNPGLKVILLLFSALNDNLLVHNGNSNKNDSCHHQ